MSFRNAKGGYIRPGYDPLEVANPPTGAGASAGNQSASVSFTAPSNTGGGSITNYYAVSNPGQITASSVTSPISVSGLTNGTEYTFKVWGENSYGPSAYSAPTGSVTPVPNYIEDVFSTYLYTGNGSTQTITNGIDLSGEGGLVWLKSRSASGNNILEDSARGFGVNYLYTNSTDAALGDGNFIISGTSTTGFSLGNSGANLNETTYASWTFRKAEKFFDVVTYTGNSPSSVTVNHNLGTTPGCIIIKCTNDAASWAVYHRSTGIGQILYLNGTQAASSDSTFITAVTSTSFTVGDNAFTNNSPSKTYVAYLFAHDAGGFGDSGTDNVISCGSYTTVGGSSTPINVNLGYEPQWVLVKNTNLSSNAYAGWGIFDSMRGMTVELDNPLVANRTDAEGGTYTDNTLNYINPTATGFDVIPGTTLAGANGAANTYIYIAIRRGPMKTPTNATSVFDINYPGTYNPDSTLLTVGFPSDYVLYVPFLQDSGSKTPIWYSRLMGSQAVVSSSANGASGWGSPTWANQTQFAPSVMGNARVSVLYYFLRAPGFMDVVCYTGTGSATTQTHNLGVTPELMIVRGRSAGTSGSNWSCYHSALGNTQVISLNEGIQAYTSTQWNNTTPTASVFSIGTQTNVNGSGQTYVAYLFATIAGISKVGSYTGNGSSQTINCGFTGGARFVMIKRTDSTGDWVVFDTARGMVSGNDPYFALNNTDRDVTDKDAVDTDNTGFIVNETTGPNINTNGGTYIFLAIA